MYRKWTKIDSRRKYYIGHRKEEEGEEDLGKVGERVWRERFGVTET